MILIEFMRRSGCAVMGLGEGGGGLSEGRITACGAAGGGGLLEGPMMGVAGRDSNPLAMVGR